MNQSLPYATPTALTARPILAAAILGVLSLGLIGLAGCFLIGIGLMFDIFPGMQTQTRQWTPGEIAFITVLYVCCGLCFIGAGILMVMSFRKLLAA